MKKLILIISLLLSIIMLFSSKREMSNPDDSFPNTKEVSLLVSNLVSCNVVDACNINVLF